MGRPAAVLIDVLHDYTNNRGGQKVSSCKNEEADGARMYYYLII